MQPYHPEYDAMVEETERDEEPKTWFERVNEYIEDMYYSEHYSDDYGNWYEGWTK